MMTATAKRRERPALRVVDCNAALRERARAVITALDCRAVGAARDLTKQLWLDLEALTGGPVRKAD